MKVLLICLWFFIQQTPTKYIVKECEQNKFKIEISETFTYKLDVTRGGYQDLFTLMQADSSVKYLINIIRAKSPILSYEYLKSAEYKNSFSDTTSKVEEVKEVQYKSFKGIRFLKKITSPQRTFLSYTISTMIKGELFIISYNTVDYNFYKYENEFNHSINSIEFE